MAVSMPGPRDLTALLMSRMPCFIVTLWSPTAQIHPEVERLVRIAVSWQFCSLRE